MRKEKETDMRMMFAVESTVLLAALLLTAAAGADEICGAPRQQARAGIIGISAPIYTGIAR